MRDGTYEVVAVPGKSGSVYSSTNPNNPYADPSLVEFNVDGQGLPGVWIKEVKMKESESVPPENHVVATLCSKTGKLSELVRVAESITLDNRVEAVRLANPAF